MFATNTPKMLNYCRFIAMAAMLLLVILLPIGRVKAQSGNCDPDVPFHVVDLTSSPSATFISPSESRKDNCCGTSFPDRCTEFEIYLHPSSTGILFDIYSGAVPSGSMYYQINCGPYIPVGQSICLSGTGPHYLTFCKPGNNPNSYTIQAIPGAYSTMDVSVRMGCSIELIAEGLDSTTVTWRDITSGNGAYDSLLSCTAGCNVTWVTPVPGIPSVLNYEVCGSVLDTICNLYYYICDTVTVSVFPELEGVTPDTVYYCSSNGGLNISAAASGGNGIYTYRWLDSTGNQIATTPQYFAAEGFYTLEIRDGFPNCPPYISQFRVMLDRLADVNPGIYPPVCVEFPTTQLNGVVRNIGGGYWSGGTGTFAPDNDTLNAFYTPSQAEINAGSFTLTLTSYADTVCPVVSRQTLFTFTDPIIVSTVALQHVTCYGFSNGSFILSASGGIAPYSYSIDGFNFQTSATFNGLAAGNYTVAVKDSLGCSVYYQVIIHQPTPLTLQLTTQDVTCFGWINGSVQTTVSGGTPPYSYQWSNGQITANINNIVAGNYFVIVTDANGCSIIDSALITQPIELIITASNTSPSCVGSSFTLISTSNTGISYNWYGPNGFIASGSSVTVNNISALHTGTYTVTVSNGVCTKTASTVVSVNYNPVVDAGTDTSLCAGAAYALGGTPTATGTVAPYSYQWYPTVKVSSDTIANPSIVVTSTNQYYLIVTDGNGCSSVDTVTVVLGRCDEICFAAKGPNALGAMGSFSTPFMIPENTTSASCIRNGLNSYSPLNNIAGPKPLQTTYAYANASGGLFPEGTYSFVKNIGDSTGFNCLHNRFAVKDHTGDGGYFMAINGSPDVSSFGATFFQLDSIPVCPHSNYEFSAFVTNMLSGLYAQDSLSFPNVSFYINGVVVATSGPIPNKPGFVFNDWIKSGGVWNSGTANYASIRIDNATFVATGNDLAIDDITFSVCGPIIIDQTPPAPVCSDDSLTIINLVNSQGTTDYSWYKWQMSTDGGVNWTDVTPIIPEIDSPTLFTATYSFVPDYSMNGYQFRLAVANDSSSIANQISICFVYGPTTTISVKPRPIADAGNDRILCYGNNTIIGGNPVAKSGTPPYLYSWQNSSSLDASNIANPAASPLDTSTYILNITDFLGCIASDTVTVNIIDTIIISGITTDASCYGYADGAIDVNAVSGVAPYSYLWSNGDTTQDVLGIPAGIHTITVTDVYNCNNTYSFNITEPQPLVVDETHIEVSCYGGNNGRINITTSGGTPSYSYLWNDGITSQNRTNLVAGTYVVSVTDANSCLTVDTTVIIQPDSLDIAYSTIDVSCNGGSNGIIDITVTGGTQPYGYRWSNNLFTEDADSLTAGNYTVTVTDLNNCLITETIAINQPTVLNTSLSRNNPLCYGGSDGLITNNVTGGTPPYTYQWTNGATTKDVSGLTVGFYTVTITDSNLCSITETALLLQPTKLTITELVMGVSCFGFSDGSIDITVSGGTASYNYLWNDGIITQDRNAIAGGNYIVTVTDAHACEEVLSMTVNEPAVLSISDSLVHVSCNDGNDGAIIVTAAGGTLPYNFNWSNGDTASNINSLIAGLYSVTVTDYNNCVIDTILEITQPLELTSSFNASQPSCFGYSDGSVNVTVAGGTLPYYYLWSNGATAQDISGITSGFYSVVITDANQCKDSLTALLLEPYRLSVQSSKQDVSCFNYSNGNIDITMSGGTLPYNYLWNDGVTTQDRNAISGGNYNITVTDAHACEEILNVTVNEPAILSLSDSLVHVSCNGRNDGAIFNTTSGGTLPYIYNWSNGDTTSNINNLIAGFYSVTVIDYNNCVIDTILEITQPLDLATSFTTIQPSCFGYSDGSINVNVAGGSLPYSYIWSNGATTQDISGITSGFYSVVITDANQCADSLSILLLNPLRLSIGDSITHVSCNGMSDGSINISMLGGTPPYTYLWNNGMITQDRPSLSAGNYSVTITDNNACVSEAQYEITQPDILTVQLSGTQLNCQNAADGMITASVSGGTMPYQYLWNTGGADTSINSLSFGNYSVTVTDNHNCIATGSFIIDEYLYNADFNITDAEVCHGEPVVIQDISTSDTVIVSHLWLWGDGTPDLGTTISHTFDSAGTYDISLVIVMQNGCLDSVSKSVIVRELPDAYAGPDASVCPGESTILSAMGGTTYEWMPNTDPQPVSPRINIVTPADTSTYVVRVSNIYGCMDYDTVQVNVHRISPLQISNDTLVCPGAEVQLEVSGGVTYQWTPQTDLSCSDCPNPVVATDTKRQYKVSASDVHGCPVSDSVTITIAPLPNGITSVSDTVCAGTSIQLFAEPGHNYLWQPKDILNDNKIYNPVATPETNTTFSLVVTNIFGCSAVDYITVYVFDSILSELPDTVSTCLGTTTQIVGNSQYNYQWTPPTGLSCTTCDSINVLVGESTLYIASVTSAYGCVLADSVYVDIMPLPFVYAGDDLQLCNGDSLRIDATTYRGVYFTWTPAAGLSNPNILNPSVHAVASTTYNIEVRDSNGCVNSDMMYIDVANAAAVNLPQQFKLCEGQPLVLEPEVIFISDAGATYTWYPTGLFSNPHATAQFIVPHEDEHITLIVESGNCKPDTQKVYVDVMPLPHVEADAPEHVIAGEQFQITTASFRADTFIWYPEQLISCINNKCSKVHAAITAPTTFTVMVTDTNGCMATDSVLVNMILDCGDKIFIPNSFTPNGDETNDRFCVRSLELMGIRTFRVFNRWGEMVFETNDLNQCWDGKFNGTPVNPDVYVYYAEGICTNGKVKMLKGNVTVIR